MAKSKGGNHATAGNPVLPDSDGGGGGGGNCSNVNMRGEDWRRRLTSNLVFPAIILWNPIPTPSMTPKRTAQPIAEFLAAFAPPRIAKAPPVKNPAMTTLLLVSPSMISKLVNKSAS